MIEILLALTILGMTTTYTYTLLTSTIIELKITSTKYKEILYTERQITSDKCTAVNELGNGSIYKCSTNDTFKFIISDR